MNLFELHHEGAWPVIATCWLPSDGPVLGCVQIAHGMTEHVGKYNELALFLTTAGFAVYGIDMRGHGRSSGPILGALGPQDHWSSWVSDHERLNQVIREKHPNIPIHMFGHSLGSYIAQDFVATYPDRVQTLMLSASSLESRVETAFGWWVSTILATLLSENYSGAFFYYLIYGLLNRPFQPARTLFDWLSRDPKEVDAYIADPLCGFIPPLGFYRIFFKGLLGFLNSAPWKRIPAKIPLAVFSGSRDSLGKNTRSIGALVRRYQDSGHAVSVHYYPDARHVLIAELNKQAVFTDILAWLNHKE